MEIIEAELCPDHIHMLVSIPPKYSVASFVGYLKGKSSLMIFDRHANLKYKYGNRHFWCGDYYYVLGYSEKQRKVINFRVDRIALRPDILAKDINPMPDDFDIENYTKEVFFMFSGKKVLVDLRCDNSLMKTMVDRFGEDVTTLAYDMTSFRVQTEVSASPTFFGWVFGFNGKVQILAPESVKEQYRQMIAKADEDMQESE